MGTKDGATVVTNDDDADEDISNKVEGGDIDHTEVDSAAAYHIPINEADLVKMSRDAIKKRSFSLEDSGYLRTRESCWDD